MNVLARIMIGVAFVLSVFCASALLINVMQMPPVNESVDTTGSPVVPVATEKPRSTFESWVLSKLSLLPGKPRERALTAVMIENHEQARPYQIGLEKAVFVGEFFVEGYISRFVALFDAQDLPEKVGPVRSLRPYFIDLFRPWTRRVFHAGGSPEALDTVQDETAFTNFNAIYLEEEYFDRQNGIPAPHDLFVDRADMTELLATAPVEHVASVLWPPYKVGREPRGSGAVLVDINFYNPIHNIEYAYDEEHRSYIRTNGRQVSIATPHNVLVVEMETEEVGPYGRLAVQSTGEGRLLLFRNGQMYPGFWQRATVDDPLIFTDEAGEPLVFAAGQTWLTQVNYLDRVSWQ